MPGAQTNKDHDSASGGPPPLRRDARGELDTSSLANVIEWFLNYDPRVAVIKHPRVEELFQWKQEVSRRESEDVYLFDHAEDRLAIGIVQALIEHPQERALYAWLSQLLNALEDASKTNEEISHAFQLAAGDRVSVVKEAAKIPATSERSVFLTCCWLETLCTAEIRVLGWVYQELYGRAFNPSNF